MLLLSKFKRGVSWLYKNEGGFLQFLIPFLPALIGAGVGAATSKDDKLKGALLGAALGGGAGLVAPPLMGALGGGGAGLSGGTDLITKAMGGTVAKKAGKGGLSELIGTLGSKAGTAFKEDPIEALIKAKAGIGLFGGGGGQQQLASPPPISVGQPIGSATQPQTLGAGGSGSLEDNSLEELIKLLTQRA